MVLSIGDLEGLVPVASTTGPQCPRSVTPLRSRFWQWPTRLRLMLLPWLPRQRHWAHRLALNGPLVHYEPTGKTIRVAATPRTSDDRTSTYHTGMWHIRLAPSAQTFTLSLKLPPAPGGAAAAGPPAA